MNDFINNYAKLNEFAIGSREELVSFAQAVNDGHDFSGKLVYLTCDIYAAETGVNWTPIGINGKVFKGTFDGRGKTISYITIENIETEGGLFGRNAGRIENLIIDHAQIHGGREVGGIAGISDGDILNCESRYGSIVGSIRVGGIVGHCLGTVEKCINHATGFVSGQTAVGGIAGLAVDVIGCINESNIFACSNVGGICGGFTNRIENCFNSGDVFGTQGYIGGICGDNNDCSCSYCYNVGNISGEYTVGGICGEGSHASVSNCYNAGTATGKENVGGVFGSSISMVSACYTDFEKAKDESDDIENLSTKEMTEADALKNKMANLDKGAWRKRTNDEHTYYPELAVFYDDSKFSEISKRSVQTKAKTK